MVMTTNVRRFLPFDQVRRTPPRAVPSLGDNMQNLSVYGYDHIHSVAIEDGFVVVKLVDVNGAQLTLKLSRNAADRFVELIAKLPADVDSQKK